MAFLISQTSEGESETGSAQREVSSELSSVKRVLSSESSTSDQPPPEGGSWTSNPKVGIIGDGRVGSALKRGVEKLGFEVRMVGRDPKGVAETARWGEVIVLAVPYTAVDEALKEMVDGLGGKVLVDVTNVLKTGELSLESTSGAEELQKKVPKARVVKAFNTIFASHLESGTVKNKQLTLLVAGDDKDAKSKVLEIGRDIGFDPVDAGPLSNARWLESLGYLNILLGLKLGMGTEIGFSLIH